MMIQNAQLLADGALYLYCHGFSSSLKSGSNYEHELTKEGISRLSFPRPGNVQRVRCFLKFASYFRKLIRVCCYSQAFKLTKKHCKLVSRNYQQSDFKTLKGVLVNLAIFDRNARTEMHYKQISWALAV